MSLFPTIPQSRHLVEFKAGKCIRDGRLLKPDTRKGFIYMDQDESGLMHFYWKERKAATPEDDLIVISADVEFLPVPQCTTGRVYQLKFKSSNAKSFFWMQAKSSDKDGELVSRVNRLINDPQSLLREERAMESGGLDVASLLGGGGEGLAGLSQADLLQYLQSVGGPGGAIQTPGIAAGDGPTMQPNLSSPGGSSPSSNIRRSRGKKDARTEQSNVLSQDHLDSLRNIIANIQVPEGQASSLDLSDVLTPAAIAPLLNDPEIASALFPHLPPSTHQPTTQELRETLSSPQFQQALQTLSVALQSGQLGPLVTQLGLPAEAGQSVEGFLRAIEDQARRRNGGGSSGEGSADQGADRMDTD